MMMRVWTILTVLMLALPAVEAANEVRVIGNRVNLRAKPDLQTEVVGQVNRGDRLTVKSMTDEWVEVAPPSSIQFWVHSDFIDGDEVAPPRLNVRAGPGINYSVVAVIERGQRVRPTGEFAEWLSIEPPSAASIWITRELVEEIRPPPVRPVIPPRPRPEPTPMPPPRETPPREPPPRAEPAPPVVHRPAPEPPRDLDLIPLEGQGEQVERAGTLRPAGFVFGRPSRYRLTRQRGHSVETLCYVKGNEAQLQSLLGHDLVITGHEYWVQGARYPVLVPEQIVLKPPAP